MSAHPHARRLSPGPGRSGRRCGRGSRCRRRAGGRVGRRTRSRPRPRPACRGGSTPARSTSRASSTDPARSYPHGAHTTTSGSSASASDHVTRTDFSPTVPMVGRPPAVVTISGTQWPGANGGSVHSRSSTRGGGVVRHATSARTASSRCSSEATSRCARSPWPVAEPSSGDGAEHVGQGVRVDREHVSAAAEVGERVVDDRDVHGTDSTEVLGHHELGVESGQGALVEVVEVLAGAHRGRHEGIDPGRVEPLGQRTGRDDPAFASLDGVVALEGHTDDLVAGADGEEDLRGRGQQ